MATPPSASASPISGAASKKPQPIPWTHQETVHLIQAYQEKWYSLKRGQLKSSQWEEVAVTIAARCGYDYTEPSKTATQCRHKMEKLRQRFRTEKQRLGPTRASSAWPYFDLMDGLERGPLPISARPMAAVPYRHDQDQDQENNDREEEDDDDDEDDGSYTKCRSINYILRRPTIVNRFAGNGKLSNGGGLVDGVSKFWGEPAAKRPKATATVADEDGDSDGDGGDDYGVKVKISEKQRGREVVLELAAAIRAFSKRFVGMENMKMEILKDTERCRMEMETKRIEMILHSQHKIVDSIARAFRSSNQLTMAQEDI